MHPYLSLDVVTAADRRNLQDQSLEAYAIIGTDRTFGLLAPKALQTAGYPHGEDLFPTKRAIETWSLASNMLGLKHHYDSIRGGIMKPHPHSWFGIAFFTLIFYTCLILCSFWVGAGDHPMLYLVGVVTVLAGTLGATFASYPTAEIFTALKVAANSYRTQPPTKKEIVDALINLSLKSRVDGLLALEGEEERVSVQFLRRALSMLVDGFTVNELCEMLDNETYFFQQRRAQHERIFRHLARLALASGIAGSIVVLIGILANSGDNPMILGAIPVALTSLLLGIILANFLFIPVAENICTKTHEELLIFKLVTEGITLISRDYNTLRLQTALESFVSPHGRNIQHKSFKEIHDEYETFRHEQKGVKS